jgi:GAF domain-containing protein
MIGVLSLYTATHRNFSPEEIEFLTALAEQGGIALEQARLIERMRENTRIFHQMAASINSSLEIKEILHNLTVTLCTTLNIKGVSIRLLNHKSGELPIVASHGLSDEFLYKAHGSIQKSVEQTLKGVTTVIENMATDSRVQFLPEIQQEGIESALFVPIKSRDDVVGIMRLFSNTRQQFSQDTINLVNALAEQGGLAIQNASLLLMLQEDNRNLERDMWVHKSWF